MNTNLILLSFALRRYTLLKKKLEFFAYIIYLRISIIRKLVAIIFGGMSLFVNIF